MAMLPSLMASVQRASWAQGSTIEGFSLAPARRAWARVANRSTNCEAS